jgi:triacylglycerol lipase
VAIDEWRRLMSTIKGPAFGLPVFVVSLLVGAMLLTGCTTAGRASTSTGPSVAPSSLSSSSMEPSVGTLTQPTTAAAAPTHSGTGLPAKPPVLPSPSAVSPVGPAPTAQLQPAGVPGVNVPSCTSVDRPVVLLHGTFSSVKADFTALVPALLASGRCVYGINYGDGGLASVRQSAVEVTAFIDQLLVETGAPQVDVIGFSQGGLVLRTGLRLTGLAPKVAVAVLVAPSFHGSTSPLLTTLPAGVCPACADQAVGSALLTELAGGGDLDGAVRYAVVSSANDTIVTPVAAQVPQGPAGRVSSILVQDSCPAAQVDHVSLRAYPGVVAWVVDALQTGGSPDPAALTCG